MDIEYKSAGMLFDELHTYDLRIEYWPEREDLRLYRHELGNILTSRILRANESGISTQKIWPLVERLKYIDRACWNAQEIMKTRVDKKSVVEAAIEARHSSLERNKLIRSIDSLLNEDHLSPIEKV